MDATTVALSGSSFRVYFQGQTTDATPATKALTAGQYSLSVFATQNNDRRTIAVFPLTVFPDASTGTPAQPHCMQMLSLIEAAIRSRAGGTPDGSIEKYSIEGTAIELLSSLDLEKLRNKYAAEVRMIQNPNSPLPSVQITFTQSGFISDMRKRFD